MEDRTYPPAEEEGYEAQYEYQNVSTNEGEEDQNYCEYAGEEGAEYPIGDGQDIEAPLLPGEYAGEDEYADYRQTRSFVPERTVKGLTASQPKYTTGYTIPRRGQVLPQRASTYYTNEVGDFRRSALNDKYFNQYPTYITPEYSISKLKRESLLRSLKDKEYRARIQKLRESRLRQVRIAAGSNYYYQSTPLTHDQLQDTFMKNYKMDARKPTQTTSAIPQGSRIASTPRSDTAAMQEIYYAATRKRYIARNLEKNRDISSTKDTKSEPVQPRTTTDTKYVKSPREKPITKLSPRNVQPAEQYVKSVNYEAMLKAAQKTPKVEDTDVEVKYKNDDFGKSNQEDTDVGCQDREVQYQTTSLNEQSSITSISQIKDDTSDDKMPVKGGNKMKVSARSNRSKRSAHTGRSKKYEDLVKLQKSKCTVMSVI